MSYTLFFRPLPFINQQSVVVQPNTSARQLIQQFYRDGLYAHPRFLSLFIRLAGLSNHLQAGVYSLMNKQTAWQLINRIHRGDVIVCDLTIVEGMTLNELLQKLTITPYFDAVTPRLLDIQGKHDSAEGLFFANTYQYLAGSSPQRLLEQAHQRLIDELALVWETRAASLPYASSYELLIAASIIEKETAKAFERPLVASVIVNRLRRGMRLQMDPTVIYAMGNTYQGKITRADLKRNSPFNTYVVKGLPPTPIAMVGHDALQAAAHPAISDYLYFVARGDGTHQFSIGYTAQKAAVQRYQGIRRQ